MPMYVKNTVINCYQLAKISLIFSCKQQKGIYCNHLFVTINQYLNQILNETTLAHEYFVKLEIKIRQTLAKSEF